MQVTEVGIKEEVELNEQQEAEKTRRLKQQRWKSMREAGDVASFPSWCQVESY